MKEDESGVIDAWMDRRTNAVHGQKYQDKDKGYNSKDFVKTLANSRFLDDKKQIFQDVLSCQNLNYVMASLTILGICCTIGK